MNYLYQTILAAFNDVIRRVAEFLPNIGSAILMLLVGWVVAKIVETVSRNILVGIRTDRAAERIGITGMLQNIGVTRPPSIVLSRFLFWLSIFLFVVSILDALQLVVFSQLVTRLITYLPNAIGALLIVVVGVALARLVGSSVSSSLKRSGLEYAQAIGVFLKYFLSFIAAVLSLAQLGVQTDILTNLVTVLIISLGLALALSLGLGSRPVVANILAGAFAREHFPEGREIQVQGIKGKIVVVGSVATEVDSEGRQITIPNTLLVENIIE